jgi:hypothetical protein
MVNVNSLLDWYKPEEVTAMGLDFREGKGHYTATSFHSKILCKIY